MWPIFPPSEATLDWSDTFTAAFELGLPVALLSWMLFYRLYASGELARDADRKAIRSGLKAIRKTTKKAGKASRDVLHNKWMRFGGGFYGVAALWTFIVMEAQGVISMVLHPSSIESLFDDGILGFVIHLIVNQITTFVNALVWFSFWSDKGHTILIWILVAYGGYLLGLNAARYEVALANRVLNMDLRSYLKVQFGKWMGPN